ncbi:MAG: sigma 54-interacting transcriptional regulator [Pirellulaceae bacterium]|jgi:Nif-specific regulatory protein|nr:sigma 54-interacting transcriptional regulator [Pirellulaceae bacterium]
MLAYLVIREGAKWTDVFRLTPGRTVTIGRASTNQIVFKDERCSRCHAEIFHTGGRWTLRDLDSRNGTFVAGERVGADYVLEEGDVVGIAHRQLEFVHNLPDAFSKSTPAAPEPVRVPTEDETVVGGALPDSISDSNVLGAFEPTSITHRRRDTKFLEPFEEEETTSSRIARDAAALCRLAFEMGKMQDEVSVANLALDGLFQGAKVDGGAILLCPRNLDGPTTAENLICVATRTDVLPTYYRVSDFVANMALREGEAVLARNIADDSTLASRDSKGMLHSTSVVCAPIRHDGNTLGLVHLYSTDTARTPDADDLHYTMYVAENVAMALWRLERQQELAEDLSLSRSEIVELRKQLGAESELVGNSTSLQRVKLQIQQAAPSRATVLIRGESGVGKELVARAVHYSSPRKNGPFVCLNCAALTETLLESELFGHERGAFTGATERKIGKFEAADEGTIMLDEIGEMSPSIQAKFLRVLEGHPFERVGGSNAVKVDVRVIAATNRDLERAVEDRDFRRDLYFRLNVLEVSVPPLRKRGSDVIELAHHFLERYRQETGRRLNGYTADALELLRSYRWPGNVRELKNVIERAVVLAPGDYIGVEDLNLSNLATPGESSENVLPRFEAYQPLTLAELEARHIEATLSETGWNKSRAATILGIERSTLDRKIRRYKLQPRPPAR